MTGILVLFLAGLLIGRYGQIPARLSQLIDRMTLGTIIVLLFVLGTTVGQNEDVFSRLPTIGFASLAISLACTAGSVVLAWAVHRVVGSRER